MERFGKLRKIVVLLIALFVLDTVVLTLMIPVRTFMTWAVIATQAVVVIYFAALSFGLVKEAEENETKEK